IMLDHTSGDSNFLMRAEFFEFSCDFIFRFLSHGTRVENNNICFLDILCIRKSAMGKYCSNSCTISIVHLASKDENMEFHGNGNMIKVEEIYYIIFLLFYLQYVSYLVHSSLQASFFNIFM
ncbi:MAG: hypothetical protein WCJ39_09305, partial [bacterium]